MRLWPGDSGRFHETPIEGRCHDSLTVGYLHFEATVPTAQ